jgi:hypothetical protein
MVKEREEERVERDRGRESEQGREGREDTSSQ